MEVEVCEDFRAMRKLGEGRKVGIVFLPKEGVCLREGGVENLQWVSINARLTSKIPSKAIRLMETYLQTCDSIP